MAVFIMNFWSKREGRVAKQWRPHTNECRAKVGQLRIKFYGGQRPIGCAFHAPIIRHNCQFPWQYSSQRWQLSNVPHGVARCVFCRRTSAAAAMRHLGTSSALYSKLKRARPLYQRLLFQIGRNAHSAAQGRLEPHQERPTAGCQPADVAFAIAGPALA
jgi:hypothetical protein